MVHNLHETDDYVIEAYRNGDYRFKHKHGGGGIWFIGDRATEFRKRLETKLFSGKSIDDTLKELWEERNDI